MNASFLSSSPHASGCSLNRLIKYTLVKKPLFVTLYLNPDQFLFCFFEVQIKYVNVILKNNLLENNLPKTITLYLLSLATSTEIYFWAWLCLYDYDNRDLPLTKSSQKI